MKFFKVFYLKRNKILRLHVKTSLATVLKACNFIKKRLQHGCFPVNIPKVLETIFFIEQLRWLLLNVLVSERIF